MAKAITRIILKGSDLRRGQRGKRTVPRTADLLSLHRFLRPAGPELKTGCRQRL